MGNGAPAGLDPPLRVDWVTLGPAGPNDERPDRIGLTFLPGKHGRSLRYPGRVYRRDLDRDLRTLRDMGVRSLVLLVEDVELERWGDPEIVERAAAVGIGVLRWPIPDGAPPPATAVMDDILDALARRRDVGDVAVACMGGVGRTGTVAACALVRAGWAADEAIATVRRVRHPTAVETVAQERFVRAYADDRTIAADGRSRTVAP